jgi:allantoicase/malate synthase/CubicO group peptidase (beta-lactamase class C family)/2-oxo-4-hydroxy-4-carboxy--5-ureidoimidazoline (OHCU) decarboxylase
MKGLARPFFEIPYYHDFISPDLATALLKEARPVSGVNGLYGIGSGGGLETTEALLFLTSLYEAVKEDLKEVLEQRITDRKFIDERVRACSQFNDNLNRDILNPDYKTIIGLEDTKGRVVFGPLQKKYANRGGKAIAPIPTFLQGTHVTLFGPPDSAKMAMNAMNSYHRRLKDEPAIVAELLRSSGEYPKWGADDEDSKTPLREDLVDAAVNLTACFDRSLRLPVEEGGKKYELAKDHLALPIKRFPGLALPCTFLFFKNNPIPIHLYDFALHLFHNWKNEQALVFYVPKLENEEEAKYVHTMIATAERMIRASHPSYREGSVRLMIVLENPRAILRTHEIIDALYPYFVGASLGWHDYLASTARIFKEDHHYRIPVKADPDIVIKYIKASHLLLADVVGSRGGIKVGGMYGILPLDNDVSSPSFQMTLKGFIKDVIIQVKRDLTGFWVAHPDFVRLGLALTEGWKLYEDGQKKPLIELVTSLLEKKYHKEILQYIAAKDSETLKMSHDSYVRTLIVADIKESDVIANNDPEEIRYNVFQTLQYLTDWLSGNGCVALPAIVNGVAVRVMDDLATAERSRWEVWHEIYHGRFSLDDFLRIAFEEMHFIRKDLSNKEKIVQVKWNEKSEKWYPIAMKIMLQLMTAENPPEFATELLLPFTVETIRLAKDPWQAILAIDPDKFKLSQYVERFVYYFEACGSQKFAATCAQSVAQDLKQIEDLILDFSPREIQEAAGFHGDIGENSKTLDQIAKNEQALVLAESENRREELVGLAERYKKKFGFKFLISAKGKSTDEILLALKTRLRNSRPRELDNARRALVEITLKRMKTSRLNERVEQIEALRVKYKVQSASVAINHARGIQSLTFGSASHDTWFELASLSKPIATAFALEYFKKKNIPLTTPVNQLLAKTTSKFRLKSEQSPEWGDQVQLRHLLNHSALNMHYVSGAKGDGPAPKAEDYLRDVTVISKPGEKFQYSGGGFLVLEHLLEALEKKSVQVQTRDFLKRLKLNNLTFDQKKSNRGGYARGYSDSGDEIPGGRLFFPAFAAGAQGTASDTAKFLDLLTDAYQNIDGVPGLSHDTAVEMLRGVDRGSIDFMGAAMGLGIFVAEAGENKIAIHQGANDGFRALCLQCFAGPDHGKGFVILCNADNQGVLFTAQAAIEILNELKIDGIDREKFKSDFNFQNLKQEQIVNLSYKALIFDSFQPSLPEMIERTTGHDPLSQFNLVIGSQILSVSNQKFARAENLLSPYQPTFDPTLFGKQGKIMDSWESVRHNEKECDVLCFELSKPSRIRYVSLSTKFHDGNQAEFVRILGRLKSQDEWSEILPKLQLQGHALLQGKLAESKHEFLQIRLEMFPDGGLTRLGLFASLPANLEGDFSPVEKAKSLRYPDEIPKTQKPLVVPYRADKGEISKNLRATAKSKIDYASSAFGGKLIKVTNQHYGPAAQVISPFPPLNMFDGLESARSRNPQHFEELQLQLAKPIVIGQVILDFKYFVNNNPKLIRVEGWLRKKWVELVPETDVKAFAGNQIKFDVSSKEKIAKLRVVTLPDGGINRIHVFAK